jgi:hypothetical protein
MEYELQYPIKSVDKPGEEITVVTVKDRIKGADMLVLDAVQGEVAMTLALIGRMCGLTNNQTEELDTADINALGVIIQGKSPSL